MKQKREPRRALPTGRLFSVRARTAVLTGAACCVAAFVLIPLLLVNSRGANAVFVMAESREADDLAYTPQPMNIALEDTPVPAADETVPPTPANEMRVSEYSLLQQEDDYPSVQPLQQRLMDLGYLDSDEPSTHYNAATTVAVSLFQRTLSDEMDGIADSELQEHLFSREAMPYEIKIGDNGVDVESMQSRLGELGYYEGKINGFFGTATEEALRAFQQKNGLDVDAVFNVPDRELLFSPSARPKIDPTPTPKPKPKATKRPSSSSASSGSSQASSSDGGSSSGGDSGGSSGGDTPSFSASYSADGLVSVATAMIGKPYTWSKESPSEGFDCSGLVYYSLRTCGVRTSRYNAAGFSQVSSWGYVGSIGELVKGDLVFFKSDSSASVNHTGIYMGGGKFVHSSSSSGQVRTSSMSTDYWTRNFINGRRVF